MPVVPVIAPIPQTEGHRNAVPGRRLVGPYSQLRVNTAKREKSLLQFEREICSTAESDEKQTRPVY